MTPSILNGVSTSKPVTEESVVTVNTVDVAFGFDDGPHCYFHNRVDGTISQGDYTGAASLYSKQPFMVNTPYNRNFSCQSYTDGRAVAPQNHFLSKCPSQGVTNGSIIGPIDDISMADINVISKVEPGEYDINGIGGIKIQEC